MLCNIDDRQTLKETTTKEDEKKYVIKKQSKIHSKNAVD